MKKLLILLAVLLLSTIVSFSQEVVRVNDIKLNFNRFKDERIAVEGLVTQYLEDTAETTDVFFLKDDWGGIIKIRTSQNLPEVGRKYRVVGIVDRDVLTQDIFISEESKTLLTDTSIGEEEKKGAIAWIVKNKYYLVGGFGGLILILLVVLLIYALRERRALTTEVPVISSRAPEAAGIVEEIPEPEEILEGTTVKMAIPPPGTLKLLPGKFVVLEGDEKIKEVRFYKEKGVTETEITFGRAEEKGYSHIQLKPQTVSAKHAKLIYAGNKFTLINYSGTNLTRVNGIDIPANGSAELKDGDKIEMGEMVFQLKIT